MDTSTKYGVIIANPFLKRRSDLEIIEFSKMFIPEISNKDCLLLIWTPSVYLQDALVLICEWDYRYYDAYCWRKGYRIGDKEYRGKYDLLLFALPKRYSEPEGRKLIDQFITELETDKSDQPVYTVSEQLFPERRKLKLFIHNPRPMWDEWSE